MKVLFNKRLIMKYVLFSFSNREESCMCISMMSWIWFIGKRGHGGKIIIKNKHSRVPGQPSSNLRHYCEMKFYVHKYWTIFLRIPIKIVRRRVTIVRHIAKLT